MKKISIKPVAAALALALAGFGPIALAQTAGLTVEDAW
ncbi:transporter, partial [Methylobacterium radiotolerans]